MSNLTIAILGSNAEKRAEACHSLAKKTTVEDVGFYNTNFQGKILTVLDPVLYPQKVQPLLFCAYLADHVVVFANELNASLGETIVVLDLLGKKSGTLISELDVAALVKGTVLEKYEVFPTFEEAKNHVLESAGAAEESGDSVSVIDHAFEVKGVGTVALGFVRKGNLKVHDSLALLPSGGELEVRSIQMQDRDQKEAPTGARFGIAAKGVESSAMPRGAVAAKNAGDVLVVREWKSRVSVPRFVREPLGRGEGRERLHVVAGLQAVPATFNGSVKGGETGDCALQFDTPIAVVPGEPVLLARLDATGLRAVGRLES